MSLSKSKCWHSNNCLHFLKCAVPLYRSGRTIDIESLQNRLLMVCYVPATSTGLPSLSFFFSFLLLQPLIVLMKQTRQAVCADKQPIFLDVYGQSTRLIIPRFRVLVQLHLQSSTGHRLFFLTGKKVFFMSASTLSWL